ncbi:MAG: hypothetical protein WBX15_13820 [Thermoanaerobaculia bacterium]
MFAETIAFVLSAVVAVIALLLFLDYRRFRGTRLVTCPETHQTAAVQLDALDAALTKATGDVQMRLVVCNRWPERANCGQECLAQIETSPDDCALVNIIRKWYEGAICVYCSRPIDAAHWHDHKPALRSPEGVTVRWHEVAPEQIPDILRTHEPVCWTCHVAESFRLQHPELITDRPWKEGERAARDI